MDQNLPVIAKKFWNIVRVAFYMLRKGISKKKFMLDLNLLMKRGKIASKAAFQNLMFHHAHQWSSSSSSSASAATVGTQSEYECSCSNTPASHQTFHLPFNFNKRGGKHHVHLFPCAHAPATADDDVVIMNAAVMKALEMIQSANASPVNNLPGFGRTPKVRQLRITDSPFPWKDVEEDSQVDEAAEKFISKFYRDLMMQASPGGA
ncbi:putative homeobox-leucine zipper protein ATHB-15-like [Capsicum annuum]|uniref:Avr9/Cf-9 rapidly elicited protein 146 n=1 Tax=Capsicum annuum TaxID=4072 RepID=A0A2G3A3M9_CAPAN|nr:uncharacterized protein LOC107865811 [Capsicum annuum]KAF3647314.1 putative homeobox-leucine zipper protein ATHB-15-like [Capsicum annuum]PHT88835.1 hypothetical protein T459_10941 [Capsicum annuum]